MTERFQMTSEDAEAIWKRCGVVYAGCVAPRCAGRCGGLRLFTQRGWAAGACTFLGCG